MIKIKRMEPCHTAEVAALEEKCFSMPWSEKSIASELDNPLSLWFVALFDEQVIGYVGSQFVMDEADMMNIAVKESFRRRGVARELVNALVSALTSRHVHSLTLEVRASNEAAKSLYDAMGFRQVGRRPNYYSAPKEDALILRKEWQI